MVVIYGWRTMGKVDEVENQYAVTKFAERIQAELAGDKFARRDVPDSPTTPAAAPW